MILLYEKCIIRMGENSAQVRWYPPNDLRRSYPVYFIQAWT